MIYPRSGTQAQWFKSRRSSDTANCVEVAILSSSLQVGVRDSKNTEGPLLTYSAESWRDFVAAVQAGEFDLPADQS